MPYIFIYGNKIYHFFLFVFFFFAYCIDFYDFSVIISLRRGKREGYEKNRL